MGARWLWPVVWAATLAASAMAAVLVLPTAAGATPQEWIDTTYGDRGVRWLTTPPAGASAVDGNGRAYVVTEAASSATLRRLTPAGEPDVGFAGGGFAIFGTRHALAVDGENRVVVASTSGGALILRRFTDGGRPDAAFGSGGTVVVPLPGSAPERLSMVHRSTGVVVLTGTGRSGLLVAVTDAGALDPTWAPSQRQPGVLSLTRAPAAIAADGDAVVGVGQDADGYLVRYTAAGEVDTAFGTRGTADLPDVRFAAVASRDGEYYALGYFGAPAIVKVTAEGELDESFGVDGVAAGPGGDCVPESSPLVITDSYIYVGASLPAECAAGTAVEVNRFRLDGTLDSGFGEAGRLGIGSLGGRQVGSGSLVGVQPDGRVLLAVQAEGGGAAVTGVTRLHGSLTPAGAFVALPPARVLDTRAGTGSAATPVPAGGTLDVALDGGGVPPAGASAVVLNVAVTEATATGFISVYPTGGPAPASSNLNFGPGQTVANLVTVKLGTRGSVTLRNASGGAAHLIADVAGYYRAGTPTLPGAFHALDPARVLDTRTGTGAPAGTVRANGTLRVPVAGQAGVPPTGAAAVVLNVTVTEPAAGGFVTVHPGPGAPPNASNLNFVPGQTAANLVTVKLGPDGSVAFHNGARGTVHLVADVAGYYLAGTATEPGMFVPLDPIRVVDTRVGTAVPGAGAMGIVLTESAGLPAGPVGAVVLTVTVTEPAAPGFIAVYPTGGPAPTASNLNYGAGQTVPNQVIVEVDDRELSFANGGSAPAHLVADVAGYFIGVDPCPTAAC